MHQGASDSAIYAEPRSGEVVQSPTCRERSDLMWGEIRYSIFELRSCDVVDAYTITSQLRSSFIRASFFFPRVTPEVLDDVAAQRLCHSVGLMPRGYPYTLQGEGVILY